WVPVPEYIFASLSISTFANPGLAMDGLVRSMKPNGKLIIVDWSKTEYPIGPNIKEKVSLDKMKYLAELYNLEIIKTFIVSEFFYGLIVQAGPNFERKNYYYRE
ncbi:MAG: SAM-dependent methyltransferase, partial [Leptospiraceae bacterium]|nr:SAM-dependent methyltransferase [Leptospiraceae bacterium]